MPPTLGNDIVDLNDAADKTQDSRFLNRVFIEKEQAAISRAANSHHYLWLLWSLKEAAFKAYQKQNLDYRFSPIECQVKIDAISTDGKVVARASILQTHMHCRGAINQAGYISVCAYTDELGDRQLIESVEKSPATDYVSQSKAVRQLALNILARQGMYGYAIERPLLQLNGYQKKGPPQLVDANSNPCHQLSLSHDGEFVAVAIILDLGGCPC